MGFKITHPLLPSRLLVWPLWHTSAWRQHVPLDRMSGTSDTTKWPQCLHFHFVLVVFLISASHRLPHLFPCFKVDVFSIPFFFSPPCFKVAVLHQRISNKVFFFPLPFLPVFVYIQSCFSFLCSWVFTDFYQCLNVITPAGHRSYHSSRCILFIIPLNWFRSVSSICIRQSDSPTWLM